VKEGALKGDPDITDDEVGQGFFLPPGFSNRYPFGHWILPSEKLLRYHQPPVNAINQKKR
jgi:hypothetical protein